MLINDTYQRETLSERPIRQPLRVSKLQKLEKGSILQVHNEVHLIMEVVPPPPSIKALTSIRCSSQWMKGHKVWLNQRHYYGHYKQARWKTCCWGIFCSRFHLILSPLKIRDGFLNLIETLYRENVIEILNASNDVIWHQKILMLNFYSTYESLSNFLCIWHELYYSPTFFRTPLLTDPLISS